MIAIDKGDRIGAQRKSETIATGGSRVLNVFRKRSLSNIVLDLVFVVWVAYFLVSGNILPAGLLANNPPTQATHIEESAPPVVLPLDDDQAIFDTGDPRTV